MRGTRKILFLKGKKKKADSTHSDILTDTITKILIECPRLNRLESFGSNIPIRY